MAWGDYDNDGDLDLYLANYGGANKLLRNDGGAFVDVTAGPLGDTGNGQGVAWGDVDNDGDLDLYLANSAGANKLFRNDGGGTFVDVTAGPLGDTGNGHGVAWGDYDNDGDLDLYLANRGGANRLFRNEGGGTFVDVTSGPLGDTGDARGVAWGDFDGDGDPDLYLVNQGTANKLFRNDGGSFVDATYGPLGDAGDGFGAAWGDYDNDGDLDLYLANYGSANKLLRNDGGGLFVDVTGGLPLGDTGNGEGVAWGDYDNDGDLDLYLTNAFAPNKLFRNDGGGTFVDATTTPLNDLDIGVGTGWGDYDNDGDLDLYVAETSLFSGAANQLFRNDNANGNHWLQVKLQGLESNRVGIGARVEVTAGGVTQMREVSGGSGYLSQNALTASFGLGAAAAIDTLKVVWPSGIVQVVDPPPAVDDSLTVVEPPPPFVDATSGPLGDAGRGRGMAWGDYDNDGDLDLYLANYGGANKLLRNDGGAFVDVTAGPLGDTGNGQGVAWGDYDNDGDLDLYLANSGGANKLLRNDGGAFVDVTAGPLGDTGNGTGVAWGDYDNDGDLDLYLANRGGPNRLFRNDGGTWVNVAGAVLGDTGDARGVVWGDYDDDGDLDLYLVNQGTTNKLFRNDGGSFVDATAYPLNDAGNGYGAAWGDYDNDGDLDLYVSNYGSANKLFRNDGSDKFVNVTGGPLGDTGNGEGVAWGDYDNDGDLDLYLTTDIGANKLLRNDGGGTFVDVTTGPLAGTAIGVGTAWGDYDNDGDLDLYLAEDYIFSGSANQLFRNDNANGNHWLQVKLRGDASNRAGIGARVEVTAGGETQMREVSGGSGYLSQDALTASFGLGATTTIDQLQVIWPSGKVQVVDPPPTVDDSLTVVEPPPAFTTIGAGLPAVSGGSVAWGDYDNDGDLDALLTGNTGSRFSGIYRNDTGTFNEIGAGLPGVDRSSAAWGDYDNDGDLDILLTGDTGSGFLSRVYRNDGGGIFADIGAGLPGVADGSVAWGDYDNDGDLDILLTGDTGSGFASLVYRNDGNGAFSNVNAALPQVSGSSLAWRDYDNDGDLDILLTGDTGSGYTSAVYRNDAGAFSDIGAGLPGVHNGSVAWGDYDNDGDPDILLTGDTGSGFISRVYRNSNGVFDNIHPALPKVSESSVAWGDYDNDGDLDIMLTGDTGSGSVSGIYRNDAGTFIDIGAELPGAHSSSVAWGDYDNDGRLDLLFTGDTGYGPVSSVYHNNGTTANTPPNAPGGLAATWSADSVTLSWTTASDDHTPNHGLGYNLRIGTSPGGSEITSAMAETGTGYRRVPALGNTDQSLSWTLLSPPPTLYWSVQAVDGAFAGSPFAPEKVSVRPFFSVQASDSTFEDHINIAWPHSVIDSVYYRVTRDGLLLTLAASQDSSYDDYTASPGVPHTYCVAEINLAGRDTVATGCDTGIRVLAVPGNFQASDGAFSNRVSLTWNDLSVVEAGYYVYRDSVLIATAPPNTEVYSDTSAVEGTVYTYCVKTFDADANESAPACDDGSRGYILPPTAVSATDGQIPAYVAITWIDPTTQESGFRIYRDGVQIGAVAPDTTSFRDSTGTPGVIYSYCVRTVRSDSALSAPSCDDGGRGTLAAPTGLSASLDTYDDRVDLSWYDTAGTGSGFNIYRRDLNQPDSILVGNTNLGVNRFSDTGAQPGVTYRYCVRAYSDSGAVSEPDCALGRRAIVVAPTEVNATDALEDRVDITWQSSSTSAVLFNVYRDGVPFASVSGTARSATDPDGVPGVVYQYCVTAVTAAEDESAPGVGCPDSSACPSCDNGSRTLHAPTGVKASDNAYEDRVLISWNDASSFENGYVILRRIAGSGDPDTVIAVVDAEVTAYLDRTGTPGTVYEYTVAAFDDLGRSATGEDQQDQGSRTLAAPTSLTATDGRYEDQVQLRWLDNSGAEKGYRVYRQALGSTTTSLVGTLGKNAGAFTDSNPGFGVHSIYSVVAFDDYGQSTAAADTGFTTILPPSSVNASDTYTDTVVVTWVDNSAIETGYVVTRDGVTLATTGPNATTYTDSSPLSGTADYCVATASGNLRSSPVCDAGESAPAQPPGTITTLTDMLPFENAFKLPGANYGHSVAISGDYAIVGQPMLGQPSWGFVFFYKFDGGKWTLSQWFPSPQPQVSDQFGYSVAMDGEWAVVGAPGWNSSISPDVGQAFVYKLNPSSGVWTYSSSVVAPDASEANYYLGRDVAISGDLIGLVGPSGKQYSVTIWKRDQSSDIWIPRLFHTSYDSDPGSGLPGSPRTVTACDHGILVGSPQANSNSGEVYFYRATTDSSFWEIADSLSSGNGSAEFGSDVSADGDHAIITAPGVATGGAAYFLDFDSQSGTWIPAQNLASSDGQTVTSFGEAAVLKGNIAVVGAGSDSAYVFRRSSTDGTWSEILKLQASNPSGGTEPRVGLDGVHVILGDRHSSGDIGAAFPYELLLPPTGVTATDGTHPDRVQISWKDGSVNEDGFNVYRDGALVGTLPANTQSYADYAGDPGRAYRYCVAAFSNSLADTAMGGCDYGWRPADGHISGRVATRAGSGVAGAQVCLDPTPNQALLLDGTGGYLAFEDFTPPWGFTVELWVNPTDLTGTQALLSGSSAPGDSATFMIGLQGNQVVVTISGQFHLFNPLTAGTWQHLTVTVTPTGYLGYGDASVQVYRNGEIDGAPASLPRFLADPSGIRTWTLGMEWNGQTPGDFFKGRLDEVRIWNGDHSQASGFPDDDATPLTGDETDLVHYWPLDDGVGSVATDLTAAPAYGTLVGGAFWSTDGAPVNVCAVADLEGNYTLDRIRYGTGTTFQVTPSLGGRQFDPSFKTITLNPQSPVQNEVAFTDISSLSVAGTVRFKDTQCFVSGAKVLLDDVVRDSTDSDGRFSVPADPGTHTLSVQLNDQVFSPATRTIKVNNDLAGQDFDDTTTRTLSGRVGGGCGISIGTVTLSIRSENGCLVRDDLKADSTYSIQLPPQKYLVSVSDVNTHGDPDLNQAEVLNFFENLGPQTADLSDADTTLDITYRAPLGLEITGFPDPPSCPNGMITLPDGSTEPAVPILAQGDRVPLVIRAYEDYGPGNRCPLDSATVTIFDEIIDEADHPDTLQILNGSAKYTTAANTPNIFPGRVDANGNDRSYQKPITAVLEVPGRPAVTVTSWVIVTGHKPRSATFTAVSEDIPILILRDPPGDGSSAFLEEGTSTCTRISNMSLQSLSGFSQVKLKTGLKFAKGTGFFWTETDAGFTTEFGIELGVQTVTDTTFEMCATTTKRFSTSSDPEFDGAGGDLFLGVSLDLVFAKTDVIDFQNCGIEKSQAVALGGDGFNSVHLFTAAHIQNTVIPQLRDLATLAPEDAYYYNSAADNWQRQLTLNDSLKAAANFQINRSFSAGADYDYSVTSDTAGSFTFTAGVFTNDEVSTGFDFNESGSGTVARSGARFTFDYTHEKESTTDTTRTVGYTLSDDDPGDYFSVDVKDDPAYGTPVFETRSGRSSCPWESNTQPRDSVIIAVEPPVQYDVPPDQPATLVLSLTNASPSEEQREMLLVPVQTSNPDGAVIRVNGNELDDGRSFFVDPNRTQKATLTASRGPVAYSYDDLKLILVPPCEYDAYKNGAPMQLADTLTYSVHFKAPCSDITLLNPDSGWRFNAQDSADSGDTLRVDLSDFELKISETDSIQSIGAEYRLQNTDTWNPVGEIQRSQILVDPQGDPLINSLRWNLAGVPDGTYEIRAFTQCQAGKGYSKSATGILDRTPPEVFGNPQPADSILSLGEDISVTFNEAINCDSVDPDSVSLVVVNPDQTTSPVQAGTVCNGKTIILVPKSPALNLLEGKTLRARVAGVRDVAGNPMQGQNGGHAVTWSFVVRANTFTWAQGSLFKQVPYRDPGFLTATLVNGTSQDLTYGFRNLPTWLVPDATSGTIPAGQSRPVQFQVTPFDLAVGSYDTTLDAIVGPPNDPSIVSPLAVEMQVICQPPDWTVDPSKYVNTMTIVAQLNIGGVLSADSTDEVAAFVGNQLRGVASPIDVNGTWLAFLTVYSNRATGETVHFQLYDASQCRLYPTSDKTYGFDTDKRLGDVSTPEVIVAMDQPPQDLANFGVSQGWTWISFNLVSNSDMNVNTILANLNPADADVVKSQTDFAQFTVDTGWLGSLVDFDNVSGYQIDLSQAGNISYSGLPVDLATNPIAVFTGWNWIAYQPQDALSTTTALGNLVPQHGDLIKSQFQFSQYVDTGGTMGWFGTLTTMEPGLGYKLYLGDASTTGGSFTYSTSPATGVPMAPGIFATGDGLSGGPPAATGIGIVRRRTVGNEIAAHLAALSDASSGWSVDPRAFQYNMTLTGTLDGTLAPVSGSDVVAAFVGDQVRGLAHPVYVPQLGKYLVFLMVNSNATDGEAVTFRLYDPGAKATYGVGGTVPFQADGVQGSPSQPVVLHVTGKLSEPGTLPAAFALGQNFPNPLNGATRITYALPTPQRVVLRVYDVAGREVSTLVNKSQDAGTYAVDFNGASLPAGLYFYRLTAGTYTEVHKMLVLH
jgi:hypothetical protein